MKNSMKALALSAAFLLAATAAMAQGSPPPAVPPIPKIAIVDIRAALLSTSEGKQMAAEIQSQFAAKQADLENTRKQDEYQAEFNDAQQDAIEKLGRKMGEVISRFARENGYMMVMDAQVCNIYCSNQLDITQEIIRLYDQAYPVKGAAAAPGTPKPAASRPATQPTKPKP